LGFPQANQVYSARLCWTEHDVVAIGVRRRRFARGNECSDKCRRDAEQSQGNEVEEPFLAAIQLFPGARFQPMPDPDRHENDEPGEQDQPEPFSVTGQD